MSETRHHDIELHGCTSEPLMSYLKALGILRLVSEQKDADARGWWHNDLFCLQSTLDKDALAKFFREEYKPTPIVAPWGARSGFYSGSSEKTARTALEAIFASDTPRLSSFRQSVGGVRTLLSDLGIGEKASDEKKIELLRHCRNRFPEALVSWLDACFVLTTEGRRFPPLLGTGGNEGSGSYVSGYAQQVVDCVLRRKHDVAINSSLFGLSAPGVVSGQTPGHFSPTAAGGANGTQGFEADAGTNPWDYLLCLEGTCLWASATVRRLGLPGRGMASFPFTVNVCGAGSPTLASPDGRKPKQAKRDIAEMWLPIWDRRLSLSEVSALLGEGRATVGGRLAENGAEFALAVNTLGVDRGIRRFTRTAFLMRNGQSFLSIPLGTLDVNSRREADLLCQIVPRLDQLRWAVGDKNAPPRFAAALHRIDSAIFDFCRYGGKPLFQRILVALGCVERELALTEGQVGNSKTKPKPLVGLSQDWINAANDDSPEFGIALALSQLHDPAYKIGPLRANLEPVDWSKRCRAWAEKDRAVVWNAADLATNLANVLQRRMMDGRRNSREYLPLASRFTASLDTVAAFIEGELDEQRIESLIWGLMLIDSYGANHPRQSAIGASEIPLPRDYALLKLLFLPRPLAADRKGNRTIWWLAREGESGITISPEPRILPLLLAGRVGEACRIATHRLRVSGLQPMPGPLPTGMIRDADWAELSCDPRRAPRLAAALLIPIGSEAVNQLVQLVCRGQSAATDSIVTISKGEAQ